MTTKNGTRPLLGMIFVCVVLASSVLASTCIVSYPAGEMDPKNARTSEVVAVDAVAGASGVLSASLEARFQTFGASLGIGLTTKPIGFKLSVK